MSGTATAEPRPAPFAVRLDNFEGPFDLLLGLIAKHRLDVTEVALSKVTDDFLAHLRGLGPDGDLEQTTEFLVVAATLLDLKAARLLPSAEVEDEEDLALLEARDLLFARLLQYRAFRRVAEWLAERYADAGRRHPRAVCLEPRFAALLPEVVVGLGPERLAALAAAAIAPKPPPPAVATGHLHVPKVSVAEQAAVLATLLRRGGPRTFAELSTGCDRAVVVARFLALLEMYRDHRVGLEQDEPLGPLRVRWTGAP